MDEKNNLKKIFNWISNVLLILLLIIGLYLFYNRIFGNSPTDFQLILWMAGFFSFAVLKLFSLIYSINKEVRELKSGVKIGFKEVKRDIKILSINIQEIKKLVEVR